MDSDLSEHADSGKGTPAKEAGAQPLLLGEKWRGCAIRVSDNKDVFVGSGHMVRVCV